MSDCNIIPRGAFFFFNTNVEVHSTPVKKDSLEEAKLTHKWYNVS